MPSNIRKWMPFYVADFIAAVGHQPNHVIGAYTRALCHYWLDGAIGLPVDERTLMRICGYSEGHEWNECKVIMFDIGGWWYLDGGRWHQKRARLEFERATNMSERKSLAGKIGAGARWK